MSLGRLGLLLGLVGLGVIAASAYRSTPAITSGAPPEVLSSGVVVIHLARGGLVRVRVAIADTPATQQTGLAGRDRLSPAEGMLFVFPEPGRPEFWMRDVAIPLSIAFIAANGTIVDVQDLDPRDERRQTPPSDIDRALEVARGLFSRTGVRVGDQVDFLRGSVTPGP